MRSALSFNLCHAAALVVALVCIQLPISAQKAPSGAPRSRPEIGTAPERTLSVRGKVLDADDHAQLEGVRVELRSFSGATVATAFTRGAGDFEFLNLTAGNYDLIAAMGGYRTLTQRLDVNGSVLGLSLELHPNAQKTMVTPGPSSISARELAIPRKAHEAMEKGEALMYQKSDYQGSIKQFERAVQEYPDYYEAYTQIGIAYLHMRNDASAEQALRKSLELSQERYVDALFWLATLLNDSQRFADAEPFARKAIEVDSNSWQANAELARTLLGLNHPAEAEKNALAATKLRPGNALLYLILANVHTQLENAPALLEDLNNYLRLAPTGPMAEQARAQRKQLQDALGNAQESSPAPSLNR